MFRKINDREKYSGRYRNRSNSSRKLPVILRWSHTSARYLSSFPFFRVFSVLFSPRWCYVGGSLLAERRPRRSRETSRAALSRRELALPTLLSSSSSSSSWSFAVLDVVVDEEFHPGALQARPKLRLVNALSLHRNHPRARVHTHTHIYRHAQNASLQCSMALILRQAEYRLRYTTLLRLCVVRDIEQISVRFTLSRRQVEKVPSTPRVCVRSDLTRLSRPAIVGARSTRRARILGNNVIRAFPQFL